MVVRFCLLFVAMNVALLTACERPADRAARPAEAVAVRLEMVTARQYLRGELRFEARAPRLHFDEAGDWLEAAGGVRAELAPALWRGRAK